MNTLFIVEDDLESPLSRVLARCYNKKNIIGSKGNGLIFLTVKENYDFYDEIIIFFDLSPNNIELTKTLYKIQIKMIQADMIDKIHFIPIIGAEYVYLKSLKYYMGLEFGDLSFERLKGRKKSCEHYYKEIVKGIEEKLGTFGEGEPEYFYVSYPLIKIVDEIHKKHLGKFGITKQEEPLSVVRENVLEEYNRLYQVFDKSFKEETEGVGIALF